MAKEDGGHTPSKILAGASGNSSPGSENHHETKTAQAKYHLSSIAQMDQRHRVLQIGPGTPATGQLPADTSEPADRCQQSKTTSRPIQICDKETAAPTPAENTHSAELFGPVVNCYQVLYAFNHETPALE